MARAIDATLYESVTSRLRNNVLVVIVLIGVAALAGTATALSNLSTIAGFFGNDAELAFFNANVQPIYFELDASDRLAEGQREHLDAIVGEIKRLDPKAVYVHAHTRPLSALPNSALTQRRGQWIKDMMAEAGIPLERVFVISHGGSSAPPVGAEMGYSQRVVVELSNTLVRF